MQLPPAVLVCGLADARAALAPGRPVCLLSAPGAALSMGVLWWRALIEAARAEAGATIVDVLDCADAPGRALEALRGGQRLLVLDGAVPAYGRVAALARSLGGAVLPARPPAFDLGAPRGHHPGALAAWLDGGDSGGRPG